MVMTVSSIIFKRNNYRMSLLVSDIPNVDISCLDSITEKTALYGFLVVFLGIPFLCSLLILTLKQCQCTGFSKWWIHDPKITPNNYVEIDLERNRLLQERDEYSPLNRSTYGNF